MTITTDATLTNNNNSKQFLFRCLRPLNNKKWQPSIDIPFINSTAANRVIFKFTGQSQDIRFQFVLTDDGSDVSNGTYSIPVQSVAQQIQYLMDSVFTHEYNTDFRLAQSVHFGTYITGVIDTIEINQETPTFAVGTLTFKRGRIGAI